MLMIHVDRYLSLRQALGFKLGNAARHLHAFAGFAAARGDTHIVASTAVDWAAEAPSLNARHNRLRDVVHLARFLHAEDRAHEVPPSALFPAPKVRPLPYIYTSGELARIIEAAGRLRQTYPLRREAYATLLGLIAATGLRISEALNLRFGDLQPDGVLLIRRTKFGKRRLVPLHPTVADALDRYLDRRCKVPVVNDHVFLSVKNRRLPGRTVNDTFSGERLRSTRRIVRLADVARDRTRPCRIHDLRHTFATRSLEQCSTRRESVSRHVVALATYLGHTDIVHTYWYLEATPELMTDIAAAAEALIAGRDAA